MFKNRVKLSKRQRNIVASLPRDLNEAQLDSLDYLVGAQIVKVDEKKKIPSSLDEARFCKICVANDFMIPVIEAKEEDRKTYHLRIDTNRGTTL